MNLQEKILKAGEIMDHVAGRNHMGPYNGILKVIESLKQYLAGKVYIMPDKITPEDLMTLKELKFDAEEIALLEKTRVNNRRRIEAIVSRLIEELGLHINSAVTIVKSAAVNPSAKLKADEIEFLKSIDCRKVDMNYVFTNTRISAVQSLIGMTKLNASQAFTYIGSLSGQDTQSLGFRLADNQQQMKDYALQRSRAHIPAPQIFENLITEIKSGNSTLNLDLTNFLLTKGFVEGVQASIDSDEISKPKPKILSISPTYTQNVPAFYNHWALCVNNETYCLTPEKLLATRNTIHRVLTVKNSYPEGNPSSSMSHLLERTIYSHEKKYSNSPIYIVHDALQNISATLNVSLVESAQMILDVMTRNKTQLFNISINIQDFLNSVRMTYVYIGSENSRMQIADKLAASGVPTDVALRVVSHSSQDHIENVADVLTTKIPERSLEMGYDLKFESLTDDQLASLDRVQAFGVDTDTALAFTQYNGKAILENSTDATLSNYTMAMKFLDYCNSTGISQLITDGNNLLNNIAYDILLIPIAKKLIDCVDQHMLPAAAQLLIGSSSGVKEHTPETPANNTSVLSLALIGTGMVSLGAAGCVFFKRKSPATFARVQEFVSKYSGFPVAGEKAYNPDEEVGLLAKRR